MCRKFILASNLEIIENKFNLSPNSKLDWEPRYVVSPGEETLIITKDFHINLYIKALLIILNFIESKISALVLGTGRGSF